jgi:hypothetical protein
MEKTFNVVCNTALELLILKTLLHTHSEYQTEIAEHFEKKGKYVDLFIKYKNYGLGAVLCTVYVREYENHVNVEDIKEWLSNKELHSKIFNNNDYGHILESVFNWGD